MVKFGDLKNVPANNDSFRPFLSEIINSIVLKSKLKKCYESQIEAIWDSEFTA